MERWKSQFVTPHTQTPGPKGRRWICVMLTVLLFLLPGCRDEDTVTVYCLTGIYQANGVYVTNGERMETVMTFSYDANGNMVTLDNGGQPFNYTYDDRGNILSVPTIIADNDPGTVKYTYDDQDRLIEQKEYDHDGSFDEGFLYAYDAASRITAYHAIDQAGNILKTISTYTYDPIGGKATHTDSRGSSGPYWTYTESGALLTEGRDPASAVGTLYTYSYDSSGRILRRDQNQNGKDAGYVEYTYSEDGSSVLITDTDLTENTVSRTSCHLDESGRITKKAVLNDNGQSVSEETWIYDEVGNVTSHKQTDSGKEIIWEWTYNDAGQILTVSHAQRHPSSGEEHTLYREYRYDEHGNLVWETTKPGSEIGLQYSYQAFTLPRSRAEKVMAIQAQLLEHGEVGPALPQAPTLWKTVHTGVPSVPVSPVLLPDYGKLFGEESCTFCRF